jgi:thiol-disulfide isomerase/thioredoxin
VTSLTLAVILHASVLATGANTFVSYAEAHKVNAETGRPLVVLIGADWCPACRQMKTSAVPQLAQKGVLQKVAFTVLNTDHDGAIAQKMMTGGSIPQLVMYRKTPTGWKRTSLTGSQSPAAIEAFINEGVAAQVQAPANSLGSN